MVTVIVLNWNARQVTIDCLDSLFRNDYPVMSVVVVDNGSKDGSAAAIARRFPQVELLQSETNLGYTGGNNLALAHVMDQAADFFLFLNNDTIVAPDLLTSLVNFANKHPAYGALTPKIYFAEPPDQLWCAGGDFSLWRGVPEHRGYRQKDTGRFDHAGHEITFANGCALFVRREVFGTVGFFDEAYFAYAEDVDLSVRMRRAGYKIGFVPDARVWHRAGHSLLSQKREAERNYYYTRNMLYVLAKHAHPLQLCCAYPYFMAHTLIKLGGTSVRRGKWRAAFAIGKGTADFVRMWRKQRR